MYVCALYLLCIYIHNSFIHSFIHSCIHSFIHSCIRLFTSLFICLLIHMSIKPDNQLKGLHSEGPSEIILTYVSTLVINGHRLAQVDHPSSSSTHCNFLWHVPTCAKQQKKNANVQQYSTSTNPPVQTAWRLLIPPGGEGDGVSSPQAKHRGTMQRNMFFVKSHHVRSCVPSERESAGILMRRYSFWLCSRSGCALCQPRRYSV